MRDRDGVEFLQWALPALGKRWRGFRKPRRQVCRRIQARFEALGLSDLAAYRALLESDPDGGEWEVLDQMCRVTISRFYRDHSVWRCLADDVLPSLGTSLRAWSAGCASGEEPYTLALVWHLALGSPGPLEVLGTDIDPVVLARARTGCYAEGTLRELPEGWREAAFVRVGDTPGAVSWCLAPSCREGVRFEHRDVRQPPPAPRFDLILCRNLVFTYFDEPGQRAVLADFEAALRPGGALVIARKERLPDGHALVGWVEREGIWRRPG